MVAACRTRSGRAGSSGVTPWPGIALLARSPDLRAELDQSTPDRVNQLASYRATVDPSFPRMAENFRRTHGPGAPFTDPAMLTGAFGVVNPLRRS
jgi:hypothetical protein